MLCTSARRLAPRLTGYREKVSIEINRRLAVAGSQVHYAFAVVAAEGQQSLVSRRRSTPSTGEEQGQRRWSSTEVAPAVKGLTLNVDEKVQRVKHRVPQKR